MYTILKDLAQKRKQWEEMYEADEAAPGAVNSETNQSRTNKVALITPQSIAIGASGPPVGGDISAIKEVLDDGVNNIRNTIEHAGKDIVDHVLSIQTMQDHERDRREEKLIQENQQLRVSIGEVREQYKLCRIDNQELNGRNFDLGIANRNLKDENRDLTQAVRDLNASITSLHDQLLRSQAQVTILQDRRIHVCVGCYREPVNQIARPCNHIPFCQICLQTYVDSSPNNQRCPVCRGGVTTWETVFLGMTNNE